MKKWKDYLKKCPTQSEALIFTIMMFINIFWFGYDTYTGWKPNVGYIHGTILFAGLYIYAVIRDRRAERKEMEKYLSEDRDQKDSSKTDL